MSMKSFGFNPPAVVLAVLLLLAGIGCAWLIGSPARFVVGGLLLLAGALTPLSLLMANQWERAVVLRAGKLHSIRGPGLFVVIPFVDSIAAWMDQRIQTTQFNAERALTSDSVPANIDAVLFWQVHDVERAALEISDYREAILRVAQTSLREMIGACTLSSLLADRKRSDARLREEIGRKIAEWGVSIMSVEIRDVAIPQALQDAMSRQAQAERERAARVTLGAAEQEIAHKFLEAANIYARNPAALQLRAMNIIYETTKERGATILIPTAMVDAMNPGGTLAMTAAALRATPAVEEAI
jgi:regulator of protease activity HflC (stomatin/prohibitin superfamily)